MSYFIFSNASSLNLSVSDNTLFSTFRGKLTKTILIDTMKKWFVSSRNTVVKSVHADFSEALMEVEGTNFSLTEFKKEAINVEEIVFYSPQELFSRILMKDFIKEHEYYFKLHQLKTRFINTENTGGVWKHRNNFIFSD
jgi:hypothetical protein